MLGGDVRIGADSKVNHDTGSLASQTTKRQPAANLLREQPSPKKQKTAHMVTQGKYTHNRAETALCEGFQTGSCLTKGKGTRCGVNPNFAHQCSVCLSPDHGSAHPAPCNKNSPFNGGGKGHGKGKGKGGKGKNRGHY